MSDDGVGTTSADEAWEHDILRSLRSLTSDDMPGLEITLLDAVTEWVVSPENPGEDYNERHSGHLVSTLFSALESSRSFWPTQAPEATDDIRTARSRVAEGAHELAAQKSEGIGLLVSRLMPALLAVLQDNAGQRGKQVHGAFVYLFYALAVGTRDEQDPAVHDGITAALVGWDAVLRGGYAVPWRPRPEQPPADPA